MGALLFTLAATVASAERGGKHNGASAAQFLSGPACAVPEQDSSSHMAFVRGRTRSGLIGGSYGEIFFASGAGTRAAVNNRKDSNGSAGESTAVTTAPGGGTSGSGAGAAAGNGNTGGAAASASGGVTAAANANSTVATDTSVASPAAAASANGTSAAGDGPTVVNEGGGKYVILPPAPVRGTPVATNPEPSTWLLFGTALCALFFVRSRQAQHGG